MSPAGQLVVTEAGVGLRRLLVVHASAELYGSDRALLESVRALQARGCATVVALPHDGPLVGELSATGAEVRIVPTVVLKKADASLLGLLRVCGVALRVLPGNVRLVWSCRAQLIYVNTVAIPLWLPLARLLRLPSVCHVHEAEEGLPAPVALLMALPLLLARHVLVNSLAARALLLRTAPRLVSRTSVLYNGVPGPAAATPPRAQPARPARLVLVGRLAPRKGTDVAVAAAAELHRRGVPVFLQLVGSVGPGLEAFEQELRETVAGAGLDAVVGFAGFQTDVWPLLAAADIVLVPSRAEPFGNVAVEAALAGRPVVASRVQGLQEIVRHGATGLLVAPDDPLGLAEAVLELLGDWARAKTMAAAAATQAHERFGVDRYAAELHLQLERSAAPP